MRYTAILAVLTATRIVVAAPKPNPPAPLVPKNPCAIVADIQESNTKRFFLGLSNVAKIKPSVLQACFRDVPINNTLAVAQIDWIQQFVAFQSTLAYLKNPPASYPRKAVDIVGGLEIIRQTAEAAKFQNQWEFELAIWDLLQSPYEGHLVFAHTLSGAAVVRDEPLVSLSLNGTDLPKVYFRNDVISTDTSYTPSSILEINGKNVYDVLSDISYSSKDPDANYNSMLGNAVDEGDYVVGPFGNIADNSTYRLSNGTSKVVANHGALLTDLSIFKVQSGHDLFDKIIHHRDPTTLSAQDSLDEDVFNFTFPILAELSPSPDSATNYLHQIRHELSRPIPSVIEAPLFERKVIGHFLDNAPDTAVLQIKAFYEMSLGAVSLAAFQVHLQQFLAECKTSNKTRLIIDVSGNGGGAAFAGLDAFKQLFPQLPIYMKMQYRAHPAMDLISGAISEMAHLTPSEIDNLKNVSAKARWQLASRPFNCSDFNYLNTVQKIDGPAFKDWKDFYGPHREHGDLFTKSHSWALSDQTVRDCQSISVSGYGTDETPAPAVFENKNVLLLTDGTCASTCAIFANLLMNQANITTLAVGGRPTTKQMAVVGGTQGNQVLGVPKIQQQAKAALYWISRNNNATTPARKLLQALIRPAPIAMSTRHPPTVNFRDGMSKDSDVPLQFQKPKVADCRIFYTRKDIQSQKFTWERIAKGEYECVDGGRKWI